MAKSLTSWVCQQCGYVSSAYLGKCPNCATWGSLVETQTETKSTSQAQKSSPPAELTNLKDISLAGQSRLATGIAELDRVLGGGLVAGSVVLLAGSPGIGKSTLLLQLAAQFTGKITSGVTHLKSSNLGGSPEVEKLSVLYISGEESDQQIALRAKRLGLTPSHLQLLSTTDADQAASAVSSDYQLVIIDSIQTLSTSDLESSAGSIGQVRESAARLIQKAKATGVPLILVGHITKEGHIAGPKTLEHMVDTVLYFEGDRYHALRLLRTTKNRFGATDEVGIFSMGDKGLEEVTNPSSSFISERQPAPGSVVTCTMEGTRPVLVEIQALVVSSNLPQPRRVTSGISWDRLQLAVAILTRRARLKLADKDIFVNVAGGLKITEPAADLALCLALAAAYFDKSLPPNSVAVGEVGLLGEIRQVPQLDRRKKAAAQLGLTHFLGPDKNLTLPQLISRLFPPIRGRK